MGWCAAIHVVANSRTWQQLNWTEMMLYFFLPFFFSDEKTKEQSKTKTRIPVQIIYCAFSNKSLTALINSHFYRYWLIFPSAYQVSTHHFKNFWSICCSELTRLSLVGVINAKLTPPCYSEHQIIATLRPYCLSNETTSTHSPSLSVSIP